MNLIITFFGPRSVLYITDLYSVIHITDPPSYEYFQLSQYSGKKKMWSASEQERTHYVYLKKIVQIASTLSIAFVGRVLEVDFIHLQNYSVEY